MNAQSAPLQCSRCNEWKDFDAFPKDPRNTERRRSSFCKPCHSKASKEWQLANPAKVNETRRARYHRNRDEIRAKRRESYDSEAVRWLNLQRFYGVSRQRYNEMLAAQDGRCAICRREASTFTRALAVDHNHSCCAKTPTCGNCVRGLLCGACNTAIHLVERDGDWLTSAATYLEKSK